MLESYRLEKKLGEGCFGTVYQGIHTETNTQVALKKLFLARLDEGIPRNIARELTVLRSLDHPNVIRCREVVCSGSSLWIVLDLCQTDLARLLAQHSWSSRLPSSSCRALMRMLLHALAYLHENKILHRDLKPSNCLLDAEGILRLSDFGLARPIHGNETDLTHEVATRWYRAPELLFGARSYDGGIDMWGAGCIFAELLAGCSGNTLFCGDGDIDQIGKIFEWLGTPTEDTWPTLTALPDWGKIVFPVHQPKLDFATYFTDDLHAQDLLMKMLTLDPAKRIRAAEALKHPYFF